MCISLVLFPCAVPVTQNSEFSDPLYYGVVNRLGFFPTLPLILGPPFMLS